MTVSTITRVQGRQLWDSRARPTVEAEVQLAGGAGGRGIAPAGASRGSGEALDLRDGGSRFGGLGVSAAVNNVNGPISDALTGLDASDQNLIDQTLIDLDASPDKSRLGANATVAVSLAVLNAAAAAAGLPPWRYLAGDSTPRLPLPQIQIFGGGAHANGRIDIQDLLVLTPGASSFRECLEIGAEVYASAGELLAQRGNLAGIADEGGWWPNCDGNEHALELLVGAIEHSGHTPGADVFIALDIAASEFYHDGKYRVGVERRELDRDGLVELLLAWVDRFPIASIEDPVAEHDTAGMQALNQAVGHRIQIVGDDYLVSNTARVRDAAAVRACNAVLLKVNQAGTVTETKAAFDEARDHGWGTIISARSGETEDVSIAHLAVGWDAGQLKVGSMARSERLAKWNEVLRIEEAMGSGAQFAGAAALPHWSRV